MLRTVVFVLGVLLLVFPDIGFWAFIPTLFCPVLRAMGERLCGLHRYERETRAPRWPAGRPLSVESLLATLAIHDLYTYGHSERVAALSSRLALHMSLERHRVSLVWHAARLHDVGKLWVPQRVLGKEGSLSDGEYQKMRSHAELGEYMLGNRIDWQELAEVVGQHHEWINGRGYPRGLSGEAIRLEARIVAVADAYDAMTTNRSYKRARKPEEALLEISLNAGVQFDPHVVESFVEMMREELLGQRPPGAPLAQHA